MCAALNHTSARGGNVRSVTTTTCVTSVTMAICTMLHTTLDGLICSRLKGESRVSTGIKPKKKYKSSDI